MKVHRHRTGPGQQTAEMGEQRFDRVLGKYCDTALLAELKRIEAIGNAVQCIVELRPGQREPAIAERDFVWPLARLVDDHQRHVQPSFTTCI